MLYNESTMEIFQNLNINYKIKINNIFLFNHIKLKEYINSITFHKNDNILV